MYQGQPQDKSIHIPVFQSQEVYTPKNYNFYEPAKTQEVPIFDCVLGRIQSPPSQRQVVQQQVIYQPDKYQTTVVQPPIVLIPMDPQTPVKQNKRKAEEERNIIQKQEEQKEIKTVEEILLNLKAKRKAEEERIRIQKQEEQKKKKTVEEILLNLKANENQNAKKKAEEERIRIQKQEEQKEKKTEEVRLLKLKANENENAIYKFEDISTRSFVQKQPLVVHWQVSESFLPQLSPKITNDTQHTIIQQSPIVTQHPREHGLKTSASAGLLTPSTIPYAPSPRQEGASGKKSYLSSEINAPELETIQELQNKEIAVIQNSNKGYSSIQNSRILGGGRYMGDIQLRSTLWMYNSLNQNNHHGQIHPYTTVGQTNYNTAVNGQITSSNKQLCQEKFSQEEQKILYKNQNKSRNRLSQQELKSLYERQVSEHKFINPVIQNHNC